MPKVSPDIFQNQARNFSLRQTIPQEFFPACIGFAEMPHKVSRWPECTKIRASLFASDFYRRRGYRRELRSKDQFYASSSLVLWIFCSILFSMVGAPANKKSTFAKAASIPVRWQSENAGPRVLDLFFDVAPHLEYVFQFFELSTKRHLLKLKPQKKHPPWPPGQGPLRNSLCRFSLGVFSVREKRHLTLSNFLEICAEICLIFLDLLFWAASIRHLM